MLPQVFSKTETAFQKQPKSSDFLHSLISHMFSKEKPEHLRLFTDTERSKNFLKKTSKYKLLNKCTKMI